MKKQKLATLSLLVGLMILFLSWFQSYPITVNSPFDFLFNHISPLYWLGLSIVLASLFVLASGIRSNALRYVVVLGVFMGMYSLAYFHYLLPGSDSHFTRGLTEYLITTGDLTASGPFHGYFQWPSFFVLNDMATSLLGLELRYFEFMLYATIGVIYVSSLYSYYSKVNKEGAFIAVIAFFMIMTYQLNYQFAPFSLCMGLLILLLMIESRGTASRATSAATLVIFIGMTFIHPFVPVFFVLYVLVRYFLSKEKRYLQIFVLTLTIYLAVLLFSTSYFPKAVQHLTEIFHKEWSTWVRGLTVEPMTRLDVVAQAVSSSILIAVAGLSGLGSLFLLLKRKFRYTDLAIFLSGLMYVVIGVVVAILGYRALAELVIPLSLGAIYFLGTKFRNYYKGLFLILMVLFISVPLHQSYSWKWFQTRDDYTSTNFFIDHYSLSRRDRILSYVTVNGYIQGRMNVEAVLDTGYFSPPDDLENYSCIICTPGLERTLSSWNFSEKTKIQDLSNGNAHFDIVYNSGPTFIAMNTRAYGR